MLSGDSNQAMNDLENVIIFEPSKAIGALNANTGEVKNTVEDYLKAENSGNLTALKKKDFDLLITKYPDDHRSYIFRSLFYFSFTSLDVKSYDPALNDLRQALKINPNSALANYFFGTIFQKMAFWTMAAARDISNLTGKHGGFKDRTNEIALGYFKEAIRLDPKLKDAYLQAAQQLSSMERYSEAIPYYDKVVELDPNNAGAFNDRGLAKMSTNDYYGATSDFSKSIELKKSGSPSSLDQLYLFHSYQNLAEAYSKTGQYDEAIDSYNRAIGVEFGQQAILMSLTQIKFIYPELNSVSDQDLIEGLRQKYYPNISSKDFFDSVHGNTKPYEDFILAGLYAGRGDVYLSKGNVRKAKQEYSRALRNDHTYSIDRWKAIFKDLDKESSIDFNTLDFSQPNLVSVWLKTVNTGSQNSTQQNYQIDCSGRKIKLLASTSYNLYGAPINTTTEQSWESIFPETMGETLYNDLCR